MSDGNTDKFEDPALVISAQGLKKKQSVRATFRLPNHIIDLLRMAAFQLGVKQKSLFDQLVENKEILRQVAEREHFVLLKQRGPRKECRQKTFVLSRRSLDVLDSVAKQQKVPRDFLVEISIERLLPVIQAEQKKHLKRKQLYREIKTYLTHGQKVLHETERILGKEDQAYRVMRKIVDSCEAGVNELGEIVEMGRTMENLHFGR